MLVSGSFHHGVDNCKYMQRGIGIILQVLSFISPGGMIVHLYTYFLHMFVSEAAKTGMLPSKTVK